MVAGMDLREIKLSDAEKKDILFQIKILNDYCDRSEQLEEGEISFLKIALPHLLGLLPMKVTPITGFSLPFERLVINQSVARSNKRLTKLEQLRYPPRNIAHLLDYNRASLKGQAIFYAGDQGMLPITIETQPKRGQLITISKWKFNEGSKINMLVVCEDQEIALSNPDQLLADYNVYLRSLQQLDKNTKEVVEAVYRFIAKAFTRRVDPNKKQGYLFSALLSDLFFNHPVYPADAIFYPSVPNKFSTMNIAIKPDVMDNTFTMIEASESIVFKEPTNSSRGWLSYGTGTCKSFDPDSLDLHWESRFIDPDHIVNELIKEYDIQL